MSITQPGSKLSRRREMRSTIRRMASGGAVVALGIVASIMVAGPAQAAQTGCTNQEANGHCYSLGTYYTLGQTFFSAAGADLTAYCLGFSNGLRDDYVNYETWVYTNMNVPTAYTWVEGGITNGPLYATDEVTILSQGVQWFWAEARPRNLPDQPMDWSGPDNYAEHFIAWGALAQTRNVAFYFEGGTNWGVYFNGSKVGTSTANGAYAARTESGMESTTYRGVVAGISKNFTYIDGNGHAYYPTPSPNHDAGTWLYLNSGYVNAGMGSCSNPAAAPAAAAPVALPMSPTTYRQTLSDVTRALASANGEPKPSEITFIKTTRRKANQALGSAVVDDADVYLVQVTGNFVAHRAHVPAGSALPTGSSMTLTVDANTGQILDWGVTKEPQDISTLGVASSM